MIYNQFEGENYEDFPKWAKEKISHHCNSIKKLQSKKDDLVEDLHDRACHYLVSNYDVIFLPLYETSEMVRKKPKSDKQKYRNINRTTVKNMLSLCNYQFKLRLEWYCAKYGKRLLECNESYTSKTRSWSGIIDEKLGSNKYIKDENIIVERDLNGSRNILIKCISKGLRNPGDLRHNHDNKVENVSFVAV